MLNSGFRVFAVACFMGLSTLVSAQETMVHFQQHEVKTGESAKSITERYNINLQDFLLLNDFPPDIDLQPGTVVLIKSINDEEFMELAAANPATVSGFHPSKPVIDLSPPIEKKPEPVVSERKPSTKEVEYGPRGTMYRVSTNGYHVVQQDQTCYRIALIYGLNLEYLMELNNLSSYVIIPGQRLRVSRY